MIGGRNDVTGAEMTAVAKRDSQFRVPHRPMLLRGLVFIPFQDGLIVDGTAERQVFRGDGVRTLLPRLLPLLSGRCTVDEVSAHLLAVPAAAVTDAVALLYSRGLLEEGGEAQDPPWCDAFPEVATFFHRHIDVTRVHAGAGTALQRLGTFRVQMVGASDACEPIAAELTRCGMSHVTMTDRSDAREWGPADLVVAPCIGLEGELERRRLDDVCARDGLAWLRARLAGTIIEIGPRFQRGEGACYRCFERLHAPHDQDAPVPRHRVAAWASLVATEVVMLASRLGELASARSMLRFNLDDWSAVRLHPPSLANCELCGLTKRAHVGAAMAYEQAVTSPSKQFLSPKAHQLHHRAAQRALQKIPPRYPSHPVQILPRDDSELSGFDPPAASGGVRVGLALVARVVRRGTGYDAEPSASRRRGRRWAPSAGNLGSVQAYVIADGVTGLNGGVYCYDAPRDVLVLVRSQRTASRCIRLLHASAPAVLTQGAVCWIVLTAALGRLRAKYGPLAYRLAHLDAGVALAQMEGVARDAGVTWTIRAFWPDRALSDELKLDARLEPLTAVAALQA